MNRTKHLHILTSILLAFALFAAGSQSCQAARTASPPAAPVALDLSDIAPSVVCTNAEATPRQPVLIPNADVDAALESEPAHHLERLEAIVAVPEGRSTSKVLQMLKSVILVI